MVKKEELIASIKSKKELFALDDSFVQQKIDKIFRADNTVQNKFDESKKFKQFARSKEYEDLLKKIRKELRTIYGVFQEGTTKKRVQLLEKLRITKNTQEQQKITNELLRLHTSTRERLPYYKTIYAEIVRRIQPKIIIDIGCGMNPLAYNYFVQQECRPTIIASDISKEDMEFLEQCFSALNIPGKTIALDLITEHTKLKTLHGDVTFLFKLLDSLEEAKRYISYNIIENITTPWIVVSFATKSLGGKKNISVKGRSWFERLLKRKNLSWETFSVENELFYMIRQ